MERLADIDVRPEPGLAEAVVQFVKQQGWLDPIAERAAGWLGTAQQAVETEGPAGRLAVASGLLGGGAAAALVGVFLAPRGAARPGLLAAGLAMAAASAWLGGEAADEARRHARRVKRRTRKKKSWAELMMGPDDTLDVP